MRVRFGDVVREVKIKVDRRNNPHEFYVAGGHIHSDDIIIRGRGRFATDDVGPAFIREFHAGQVLYLSRNAYLKKVAFAHFDGVVANTTFVLETKDENILCQRLLPFLMLSDGFTDWAVMMSKGSTNPYVVFNDIARFEFDLPSIEAQRKLARVLWAVNDTAEAYRRLISATRELVQGRFVEMFGNPIKNEKCWPSKKMQDVAISSQYNGEIDSHDNNFWLLNLDMIEPNTGRIIEKVYVPREEIGQSTFTFSSDFVLYSKLRPYLNKVVIPDGTGYATTELIPLLPKPELLNQIFLASLLRSHNFVSFISSRAAGTQMPRVIMDVFRNFEVIIPPYDLQQQFADFVNQSEKSISSLQHSFNITRNILKRILAENLR